MRCAYRRNMWKARMFNFLANATNSEIQLDASEWYMQRDVWLIYLNGER